MRGEDGVLVRGKFTPIRSGHLPPQKQGQARGPYGLPGTGSEQGQRMMAGALTGDEPARVVRFANQNGVGANSDLRGRAGQGTTQRDKIKTQREKEKAEKWLKKASWVMFCCGLCEKWDLAAADSHGQSLALIEDERRR